MSKKTFCPFINGECTKECMFYSITSACYDDKYTRNCLIATMTSDIRCLDYIVEVLENKYKIPKNKPNLPEHH